LSDLDDAIDKLLQTSTNPANEPNPRKIGAEWQAGVIWNGDEGTITTTALPLEELDKLEKHYKDSLKLLNLYNSKQQPKNKK
jgi:hypothetical protein